MHRSKIYFKFLFAKFPHILYFKLDITSQTKAFDQSVEFYWLILYNSYQDINNMNNKKVLLLRTEMDKSYGYHKIDW